MVILYVMYFWLVLRVSHLAYHDSGSVFRSMDFFGHSSNSCYLETDFTVRENIIDAGMLFTSLLVVV